MDEGFALSLLDYDPSAAEPANPELGPVDLGESHLVGVGAVGNGTVWALSRVPELSGELHLVDHEEVDLTNPQRYVLATMDDVGASKVDLAEGFLRGKGLEVRAHPERWGAYLGNRGDWHLRRVAVAVDSADGRRAVQAALPRWIVNAWTQPDDLGVSRHSFLGDQACLTCLYLPEDKRKSEAEIIAEVIGFPEEWREVGARLYKGTPTDRVFLERIAAARRIDMEQLLPFEGKPLRVLYREGVCGGAVIGFGDGSTGDAQAEVPMAFQSALAGIMLAAELVANAADLREAPPPVTTRLNVLRPLGAVLSFPLPKNHSGRCICQDEDYAETYRAKYG
ncbi:MAG: ThiF family adenylyltransferase [Actinomycetota bacterium]|nr:ThiF family adenylyltransferase [Actinomycetota bacterium]